tara:strand:- start:4304 stop:5032 length:729 start_codon:yes stop_codon:yes gene_type:complete
MDKFVSIVIPAYNEVKSIEYTLRAFNQMYDSKMPFEIIVIEDGSETSTKEVCEREYKFPVKYIWQPDEGFRCALAKNNGIRAAEGTHIFILDGDSFPSKNLIADYWPLIDKASDKVVLYGWRHTVGRDYIVEGIKQKILEKDWRKKLRHIPPAPYDFFSSSNVMIPANLAKKVLWAPDDWIGYGLDDHYFCLNWILNGGVLAPVDIDSYHMDEEEPRPASENISERFEKFKEEFYKKYYDKE